MTYRSLLVLLDNEPSCAERMQVAIRLAVELDCHLVGLAPTGLLDVPASMESAMAVAEFAALVQESLRDTAERAAQAFRGECADAGFASFEALIDASGKASSLVRHAHCSDLAVLTQADPAGRDHAQARALIEQIVLYSARPTLVLPCAGRFDRVGSRVVVAWDDSREAARALADALPLLRRAEKVQIVRWSDGSDSAGDDASRCRLDALRGWLARHGVPAAVKVEPSGGGIADALLSHAADAGCDLIVMGAYGHARWTERLLGGATQGLLASMTVPVLMSH